MPSGVKDEDTRARYGQRCSTPDHYQAPAIYGTSLANLEPFHLEIECGCGHSGNLSMVAMIRHHGGDRQTLGDLLPRLTCSQCKKPPAAILLNQAMFKHFAYGPPRGWSQCVWPMTG